MRLVLLICFSLLTGCALFRAEPEVTPPLPLLAPSEGPAGMLLKQSAEIRTKGQQASFILISRFDPSQTRLAALMATGQPIILLEYDGDRLQQKVSVPVELPGRSVLALIQFAEWPESALIKHYSSEEGWALSLEAKRRQLWHHGALILDVTFSGDHIRVTHYLDGYGVSIKTLERKDLQQ